MKSKKSGCKLLVTHKDILYRHGAGAIKMVKSTPVTTYHAIPIYLKPFKRKSEMWLQWTYEGIQYGVRVSNMGQALYNAQQMIDAMLELEAKSYKAMSF